MSTNEEFEMNPKRQKVQDHIIKVLSTMEPEGYNSEKYKTFFESMSDIEFDSWMKEMKNNKNAKVVFLIPPFKVALKMDNIFKAARLLGLTLRERLRIWDPDGKRYCLTPKSYFVLKVPVRRLKQYLQDGLSVPESDRRLNPLTDQVVKPDKGSAISFPQAQMIAEKGLVKTLHELMTIRGGDQEAYSKMKAEIEESGESTTSVMEGTRGVKSAQTLRSFLNAMHLDTNI